MISAMLVMARHGTSSIATQMIKAETEHKFSQFICMLQSKKQVNMKMRFKRIY